MSEISKYTDLKTKLEGICDENSLVFSIQNKSYPFFMKIKPVGGMGAQMSMLEDEGTGEAGYLSPEAELVFAYRDGELTYKMSDTINIGDALFNKLKNIFTKLHKFWMMYFFRDVMEHGFAGTVHEPDVEDPAEDPAEDFPEDVAEAFEVVQDPEDASGLTDEE